MGEVIKITDFKKKRKKEQEARTVKLIIEHAKKLGW